MEIVFLGTSASVPTKARNLSCCALKMLDERRSIWLFDCGEATQHRVLHTSISLSKLEKIFITHLHGDHLFGLPGLLSSRSIQGETKPLTLYGPSGLKRFVDTALEVSRSYLGYPLEIKEFDESGLVFEDAQCRVQAIKLHHGVTCFGYRVEETDRPGTLDAERLKVMGIKAGPIFQELKKGLTVTLEDGRTLNGAEFMSAPKKGRILTFFGDNTPTEANIRLAQNADIVVHEATFEAAREALAINHMHATTTMAAQMAKDANAKKLIITHLSARYSKEQCADLLAECQAIFPNTELANDLSCFEV